METRSIPSVEHFLNFLLFDSPLVPLSTSIRYLRGELKQIKFNNIELHYSSTLKKITLNKFQSSLVSLFQTILIFLFPPSLIFLTSTNNNGTISFSFCSMDMAFQRNITVSFVDGKLFQEKRRMHILHAFISFSFFFNHNF